MDRSVARDESSNVVESSEHLVRGDVRGEKRARTENTCDGDNKLDITNVLEVVNWNTLLSRNVDAGVVFKDVIKVSPSEETTKAVVSDIGYKLFSLMIEGVRDNCGDKKMTIVVRYVNDHGVVMERLIGGVHDAPDITDEHVQARYVNITDESLKRGIDVFFAEHGLSFSKLRGQGYDGAFEMNGGLEGWEALILKENPCARYVHCFAYQLQLIIVAASVHSLFVGDFYSYLPEIMKMIGSPCRRKDEVLQKEHENMVELLEKGEISAKKGLHQESTLARPGETSWGSQYMTVVRLLSFWSSAIEVLDNVFYDGTKVNTRCAYSMANKMESYQFVFAAHLMKLVLGLTNDLSQFLQQKDHSIIEVVSQIQDTKRKFQDLRENGWDELLQDVNTFCAKNGFDILNMEDIASWHFLARPGRSKHGVTNYHLFRVDTFCKVIDHIGQALEHRFSESNIELLTCIACLDPKNSFSNFNESKLLRLAELHPREFLIWDQMELKEQLKMWIYEMRGNESFSTLQDIGSLAEKMVEVRLHKAFHLVYRLIESALLLPVTVVERASFELDIIEADKHNNMGNDLHTLYHQLQLLSSFEQELYGL